jgi:zinc/manganese transport system substrate-binding protein
MIIVPFGWREEPVADTPPERSRRMTTGRTVRALSATLVLGFVAGSCSSVPPSTGAAGRDGRIVAVGAENQYADVIGQIGGRYVEVTSILDNPNTDPHTFESSPSVARAVGAAELVVQNGLGYDDFMTTIEEASPDPKRTVIDVQDLRHLPDSTPNPHLWYDPKTMPVVAEAIAYAAYFEANLRSFEMSLTPWFDAIARFKAEYPGTPVATTEPVGDDMLQAAGTVDRTPFSLQAAIMNGTDPSPEDVSLQMNLFTNHKVKVFVYNEQVTDSLTQSFLDAAERDGIPVVAVYETMPTPGYDYQSWMVAEVRALDNAVAHHVSTKRL